MCKKLKLTLGVLTTIKNKKRKGRGLNKCFKIARNNKM